MFPGDQLQQRHDMPAQPLALQCRFQLEVEYPESRCARHLTTQFAVHGEPEVDIAHWLREHIRMGPSRHVYRNGWGWPDECTCTSWWRGVQRGGDGGGGVSHRRRNEGKRERMEMSKVCCLVRPCFTFPSSPSGAACLTTMKRLLCSCAGTTKVCRRW